MGTQFAIIYDVIAVAVIAGLIFAGAKKGFAAVLVGLAAVFVAFFCASLLSTPISGWFYETVVERPLEESVDSALDEAMGKVTLSGLSGLDYSRILIMGESIEDVTLNYAGTGRAMLDLSEVDLSGTGIADADLTVFGFEEGFDYSSVSGKTAEFTQADIEQNGLGKMVTAQVIAVRLQGTDFFKEFTSYTEAVEAALPFIFGDITGAVGSSGVNAARSVILTMINTSSSVKESIINEIIEPAFRGAAQTAAFMLIFGVVSAVLAVLAHSLELVNKIPVLGSFNAFAGGLIGLGEGVIALCVVCVAFRLIIAFSGGEMIFLNEAAIESTYIFRLFYNIGFLDLTG